jgi:hypothetical protein
MIDIPEETYNKIFNTHINMRGIADNAIANGTPIPDNATNGDVIKAIFPNTEVDDYDYGKDPVIDVYGIDDTEYITLRKDWWNAPYKKGGK